ncbi:hypothetical protein [Geminocystis sp. NIES-3709]|uniref:hypothetical protein n=1 Tax=Geminocystis sp. NIES-3709 TaxID=1617448 RepID=UPI0005FC78C4|nr:hypothetical protein [Geminocystis sp. NIES-3709]BAQ66924.1 hypothetical protein GM3709_3689 [Geminocystis sp. NIES-3709]
MAQYTKNYLEGLYKILKVNPDFPLNQQLKIDINYVYWALTDYDNYVIINSFKLLEDYYYLKAYHPDNSHREVSYRGLEQAKAISLLESIPWLLDNLNWNDKEEFIYNGKRLQLISKSQSNVYFILKNSIEKISPEDYIRIVEAQNKIESEKSSTTANPTIESFLRYLDSLNPDGYASTDSITRGDVIKYLKEINYKLEPKHLTMEDLENIAKKGNVGI